MPLEYAIILDLIVLILCIVVLLRFARLTALHPATWILVFHSLFISFRAIVISLGAPTFLAATNAEVSHALVISTIGLVFFSIGAFVASQQKGESALQLSPRKMVDSSAIRVYLLIVFAVSLLSTLATAFIPGVGKADIDLGSWNGSSWVTVGFAWFPLVFVLLIYINGFKKMYLLFFLLYLIIGISQGYHRIRVVAPIIFLLLIFIERKNIRWMPVWMILSLSLGFFVVIPLKNVGSMIQNNTPFTDIIQRAGEQISNSIENGIDEIPFLDQCAVSISLLEKNRGDFFYFSTYLPLLTLPIPRPWWPDKPGVSFYRFEIQTEQRPVGTWGTVVTYVGEAYFAFGIVGVIVICFITSYCFSRLYFRSLNSNKGSPWRLLNITFCGSMFIILRDGTYSLVIYPLVYFLPITFLCIIYIIFRRLELTPVTSQVGQQGG